MSLTRHSPSCHLHAGTVFLFLLIPSLVLAQDEIIPEQGFLLSNVSSFRRAGIDRYDPLEGLFAREGIESLNADHGVEINLGDGEERVWKHLDFMDGGVDRRALGRGGYVYVPVDVEQDCTMILAGSSHGGLYVNGVPHASNVYGYDYYHIPIALRAGTNGILLKGGRKGVKLRLYEPPAKAFVHTGDPTLPDLIVGQPSDAWAAVIVINATDEPLADLAIEVSGEELTLSSTEIPTLPPMGIRKVGFRIVSGRIQSRQDPVKMSLRLLSDNHDELHSCQLELRRRLATDAYKKTFVSKIDGSVQYFGLRPAVPLSKDDPDPALVLSCHGASVKGIGQAQAYSSKSWLHLVAPTNRRPFGFDWEDLGRADAMEVLEYAKNLLKYDPSRVYLTGHSMGGHGTWHLGSLFPDHFAAIGPSAGWISYSSYASRGRSSEEPSPIQELLNRGRIVGDPRRLSVNFKQQGIYILHGAADDNVPASQADEMAEMLKEMHHDWDYHSEPGKKHWWSNDLADGGAACMDWPEMYDSFARHALPPRQSVRKIEFATANPGVSSSCHWLHIERQHKHHEVSQVEVVTWPNKRQFKATTSNTALLAFDVAHLTNQGPIHCELDGQTLEVIFPQHGDRIWFENDGETWKSVSAPNIDHKGSHRYGSIKNELRNRYVMVYGTQGSDEERRWNYAKARLDSETLWYRGNASVSLIADTEFEPQQFTDRSVVLYGNADSNSQWSVLLAESPIQVSANQVAVGERLIKGDDLTCLFIQPRRDSDLASVIAISATGVAGIRLSCKQSLFQPFVRYPDCVVLRVPGADSGRAIVEGTGYFGADWSVANGEFRWK